MADFETHPAGTADLVKRLRSNTPNMAIGHAAMRHAADRIEHLEAALTRANAATAAAYEVAARVITDRKSEMEDVSKTLAGVEKIIFAEIVSLLDIVAAAIRALATPDQTAALDRLIADEQMRADNANDKLELERALTDGAHRRARRAEAKVATMLEALQQISDQTDGITPEPDNLQMAIGSINSYVRAILAASKKGGA